MLTKQETIGKAHRGRDQQGKGTQENCCAMWLVACSLRFYGDGISFWVVFGQSFFFFLANHSDSRVLPGGTCIAQPRWILTTGILGGGWTHGVLFRSFLNSSGWWWLISLMFFTRTFCHKIANANNY